MFERRPQAQDKALPPDMLACPLVLHSAELPCSAAWSDFLSGLHCCWHPAFLVLRSKVLSKELLADSSAHRPAVFEGMLIVETSVDSRPEDLLEPVSCIIEGMRVDPVAEG